MQLSSTSSGVPAPPPPTRGFRAVRELPTLLWLGLGLAAAAGQTALPLPRWLLVHLLLLGAITHAILVWSQYFSFALLRSRPRYGERRAETVRLLLANGGAALVLVGVPLGAAALAVVGAAALIAAVGWHGAQLARRARASLPGRFGRVIRYYLAAAALLVLGAGLGALLASGHGRPGLGLAHALLNVLGWMGLTVAGTVVTLWPTMLRTRADEHAAAGATRALPALVAGALLAAGGAALQQPAIVAIGATGSLVGLGVIGAGLGRTALRARPRGFAALSVGASLLWWAGAVAALAIGAGVAAATGSGLPAVQRLVDALVPLLVAGFAVQVLIGALSYLLPVVLGGGPGAVRAGTAALDRLGAPRVLVANTALAVAAAPLPESVRQTAAVAYLLAVGAFVPIAVAAVLAQRRSGGGPVRGPGPASRARP